MHTAGQIESVFSVISYLGLAIHSRFALVLLLLSGGSHHTRLGQLSHAMPPLSPVSLEVNQGSSLTALPGETVQIMFDLTNVFDRPVKFFFAARDQFQYVRNVHPLT